MDLLFLAHLLNGLLMIAMPVGLAIFLISRWKLAGRIWWVGAATLILSQVGHIPFNWLIGKLLNNTSIVLWNPTYQLIFNAVFLGLSAGIFEELARFLVMKFWAKDVRSWRTGILLGAGHGGAEAIILGIIVMYSFLQLLALRNADLSTLFPSTQLAAAQHQVLLYWSANWYESLLGALERFFTIPCQIALTLIVLQVFLRKNISWLFLAIGYQALFDGMAIVAQKYIIPLGVEGMIGGFAILSVVIIFILKQPEPEKGKPSPAPAIDIFLPESVQETSESLERTRYQ